MSKLLLSLVWPAVGIAIASWLQLGLTTLWPGVEQVPSVAVSIDGYIALLSTIAFCFLAGRWTRRNTPTIAGIVCALIAPMAWFVLMAKALFVPLHSSSWVAPLTLFTVIAALAPLIGVLLGWTVSGAKSRGAVRVV